MSRESEVKQFLMDKRARLTPVDAGLQLYGGERRVPGLRREEVAQLAGMSTAYYTRMERGNLRGVSESVLNSLARALHLNEAERHHLMDLARSASSPRRPVRRNQPQPSVSGRMIQLLDAMEGVPALVVTALGDVVASNAMGRALFPDLFPQGQPPLNHHRYLFLDPRSQSFYVDWLEDAQGVVATLRLIAGHEPGNPSLEALISELVTRSDKFRMWWHTHKVQMHLSGVKRIHHPVVGRMNLGYESLTLPSSPGLVLVTYLADAGTPEADAMAMLQRMVATPVKANSPIA